MRSSLLLIADRIHVLGDHEPVAALLVRDGRVAAIGSEAEVRSAAPAGTAVLRLPGATLTPGITDAHVHLTAWALARQRVALGRVPTLRDGLASIRSYAAAHPEQQWILGLGWDRHGWGGLPTRQALDAVVPDRPAYLESHDIHAAWLNTAALQRCGITAATPDPEGGHIVRDPGTGEPSGVLLENAKALASPHLPTAGPAEVRAALLDAQREAHRLGITGVHSVEPSGLADFSMLERGDLLRLRVLQHLPLSHLEAALEVGLRSGWRSPGAEAGASGGRTPGADAAGWIRIGGVKMFLDGALGSRTAWMRERYAGTADDRGIQTLPPDDFRDLVRRMSQAGFAATVHAIGDAAVELALDVLSDSAPPAGLPHRIEHVQLCPPDLWERAGRSGIIGSMQPVHLLSDIPAAEEHWGHERCRGAYAFAPLLRAGMTLAFGSDVPVETIDPRPGLFAAVRRVSWEGLPEGEWYPEHRVSAEQALRGYTEGPARAAGEAMRRGRLLPGFDADFVAWDHDPLRCAPEDLRRLRCLLTAVGGEIVHRSDEAGG
jgi:predicted amidohydrolase YtcJ